jgi:Flp pilus assembly protein TadD
MEEATSRPSGATGRVWVLAAGAAVLAGSVLWALRARPALAPPDPRPPVEDVAPAAPPADPRRTYSGPYRNIHPDAGCTGDAECARCHADIAASYARHPMGRSLAAVAAVAGAPVYDAAHHNPFEDLHSRFLVERRGERVWHRQVRLGPGGQRLYEREVEVHYAIGSGTHGFSYLTDRDGYLFQTAISWFSQKQVWDLSPAFVQMQTTSRPIGPDCLFCHVNRALHRPGSLNHYDAPIFRGLTIGCERCHGPGERHVASAARLDIVNPGKLSPSLREAVCQQCHLAGETRVVRRGRRWDDFRPGLPLEEFVSVFVWRRDSGEERKAVNHVEQMYQSRCFRDSRRESKMGCISCHDPHVHIGPERRQIHYRQRCLKCHEERNCTAAAAERRARADSCIDCHMPPQGSQDVAHTAVTDHRILRKPAAPAPPGPAPPASLAAELPVAPFAAHPTAVPDAETSRDLGIALVALMAQGKLDARVYPDRALSLLETATRRDPDDVDAWQARVDALRLLHQPAPALRAAEEGLRRSPDRERLLARAGRLAADLGDPESALRYWRRAVAVNPWLAEYREGLATLLAQRGEWEGAGAQCRDWLRLDPESVPARMLWIRCLLHNGKRSEARAEADTLGLLQPDNRARLEAWLAEQTREASGP